MPLKRCAHSPVRTWCRSVNGIVLTIGNRHRSRWQIRFMSPLHGAGSVGGSFESIRSALSVRLMAAWYWRKL
jgi:hypothetical protein